MSADNQQERRESVQNKNMNFKPTIFKIILSVILSVFFWVVIAKTMCVSICLPTIEILKRLVPSGDWFIEETFSAWFISAVFFIVVYVVTSLVQKKK